MPTEFIIDIQQASDSKQLPTEKKMQRWARHWLKQLQPEGAELSLRIVDVAEMQALNFAYRKQNKPTNVLSFPAHVPKGLQLPIPLLGDIVICATVVTEEARDQAKTLDAHWAHMVLHGLLHLLGYDHIENTEAQEMEQKEIELLAQFGFNDPYY